MALAANQIFGGVVASVVSPKQHMNAAFYCASKKVMVRSAVVAANKSQFGGHNYNSRRKYPGFLELKRDIRVKPIKATEGDPTPSEEGSVEEMITGIVENSTNHELIYIGHKIWHGKETTDEPIPKNKLGIKDKPMFTLEGSSFKVGLAYGYLNKRWIVAFDSTDPTTNKIYVDVRPNRRIKSEVNWENVEKWLDASSKSVVKQNYEGEYRVIAFVNDAEFFAEFSSLK